MVSSQITDYRSQDGIIHLNAWLQHIAPHYSDEELRFIQTACQLAQEKGNTATTLTLQPCSQAGLAIADMLFHLKGDAVTLAAAILYPLVQSTHSPVEEYAEQLPGKILALLKGVLRLDDMRLLQIKKHNRSRAQTEHLRKMLVAMADDARAVLIKLAERTHILQTATQLPQEIQRKLAQETQDIYAPLANRLGIWQLKWRLEDQALRYLEPDTYKSIAKAMKARRIERDRYIQQVIAQLTDGLVAAGIQQFEIAGRAKHIYSIARKMQRKKVSYEEIYDASALRVLVSTVSECYAVLGVVHGLWEHIPEEFDDYIAHPKPNGYRSLHTAVIGPEGRNVEVQIRTHEMHAESELGVAAHWAYKEGQAQRPSRLNKLDWLRRVLDWQREVTHDTPQGYEQSPTSDDAVYVFTPAGDIIALPIGATPLDFAYHIHTQLGHRCRGAKVNGKIVPLTYQLQTGEQVDILTYKEPNPSRDWANPQAGYLVSTRARAKVLNWFRQHDQAAHYQLGQELLEKELRRHAIKPIALDTLARQLRFKSSKALLTALGAGNIKISTIKALLQPETTNTSPDEPILEIPPPKAAENIESGQFTVAGIDNVLNHIAQCCKPLPGEAVLGFITQGRGVSIHRANCANIAQLKRQYPQRIIKVNWLGKSSQKYLTDLNIIAQERSGLIRDISTVIANEKLNLTSCKTFINKTRDKAYLRFTVEVANKEQLEALLTKIKQLPDVLQAKRTEF